MSAVVTAIVSVALSGVVAAIVTHRLQMQAQRAEMLRQKLEEAWMAADAYCGSLGMHYIRYGALLRGEIDANQVNDLTIEAGSAKNGTPFQRLEMLLDMYIPSAMHPFRQLLSLRDELNGITWEHRRRHGAGPAADLELHRRLNQGLPKLDDLEAEIKGAIASEVRRALT